MMFGAWSDMEIPSVRNDFVGNVDGMAAPAGLIFISVLGATNIPRLAVLGMVGGKDWPG